MAILVVGLQWVLIDSGLSRGELVLDFLFVLLNVEAEDVRRSCLGLT